MGFSCESLKDIRGFELYLGSRDKRNSMNDIETIKDQPRLENKYKIGILALLTIILFGPVFIELFDVWSNNEDYSHGFFVIPISLYIAWGKRAEIIKSSLKPSWLGLPLLIGGSIGYVVALLVRFHTLTYLSMMMIIVGLLLFLGGWKLIKILLLPIFFLLFMFPIPTAYYILITNPLKLMITKISMNLIYSIGIPVYREGNLLHLASTSLEVAEACSGIRSLYSYLMLGCLFAYLSNRRLSKVVLVVSTFPLAILVNTIRVTGTGILAHYFGSEVAQGFFHEFAGFVLFGIGLVALFITYHLLESRKTKSSS